MRQYNRIAEIIEGLHIFPEGTKPMESERERMMELRQLAVDHDSVFYIIENMQVIVTRVLYSAMDISRRLLEGDRHF